MELTKLDLATQMKKLLSEKGKPIVEALEKEKKEKLTNSDTDKARTALFLEIKSIIDAQGVIFKKETENAVKFISELSASCSLTLKQTEEAVKKLQSKFDPVEARKILDKLKPLADAPEGAKQLKAEMVKHLEWRGSLVDCTAVLGDGMSTRLNTSFTTWRDAPLKAFMDTKDKFIKVEEYQKRAEHFGTILNGLMGGESNKQQIIAVLGKDQELIDKYEQELLKVAADESKNCTSGVKELKVLVSKKADTKGLLPRLTGLQNKLKVARSQLHTAQIVRDGFLKKAGPLAGGAGTKNMAEVIKKQVAGMEKQVQTFQMAFEVYKKEFNNASPTKI
jgi:hypothetical protein